LNGEKLPGKRDNCERGKFSVESVNINMNMNININMNIVESVWTKLKPLGHNFVQSHCFCV